jgi:Helix-turn-helix domain
VLTVDDYGAIRRAHRDGMPIKRIAREFGHSRNTIRKVLSHSEPNPIPGARERTAPVLGPFSDDHRPDPGRRTRTHPPSIGTPPCRCSVASATSTKEGSGVRAAVETIPAEG